MAMFSLTIKGNVKREAAPDLHAGKTLQLSRSKIIQSSWNKLSCHYNYI